tara:strand:+ start:209 stop:442 length:234 start_codon:yes stop_codon:yes gene_type:complete
MREAIKLELEENDDGCAIHKVKVNGMTLVIFQHENGRVSINVHGMKEAKGDISIHDHKVSKRFVNKHHTWSVIKVVE